MSTSIGPTFTAGGLASGLDTNTIIDGLVKLESQPIVDKQAQQAALRSQISLLGQLAASLTDFGTAAKGLGTSGVLSVKVSSANSSFSASTGPGAQQGDFAVSVQTLAAPAKARSAAFASSDAPVRGGTLNLSVQGTAYAVTIADGASLADVALAIRQSGAPVSATVLNDGTSSYLSVTAQNTGYTIGSTPDTALTLSETSTGTQGQPLGLAVFQQAANATFTIDGLSFTRTSNTVTDALPGTTLSLKSVSTAAEDLVLVTDVAGTADRLQALITAYNNTIGLVQKQLDVSPGTDRTSTLAGDSTVRNLQASLQSLVSATVPSLGTVRSLADLGVKTERDGSLSLDKTVLEKAIARDPGAVDDLFATASTGLSAQAKTLTDQFTDPVSGAFTTRTNALNGNIKLLDNDIANVQARVDQYKQTLIAQFTAMESVVSQLKSLGTLLNQISINTQNNTK
ncbi:MAG TPA: flagellar filament capping protein FliD [Myxococcaceae bacterium]|nr:flagellar filament capping protein FliD [Myxococcaceae bacterium]